MRIIFNWIWFYLFTTCVAVYVCAVENYIVGLAYFLGIVGTMLGMFGAIIRKGGEF